MRQEHIEERKAGWANHESAFKGRIQAAEQDEADIQRSMRDLDNGIEDVAAKMRAAARHVNSPTILDDGLVLSELADLAGKKSVRAFHDFIVWFQEQLVEGACSAEQCMVSEHPSLAMHREWRFDLHEITRAAMSNFETIRSTLVQHGLDTSYWPSWWATQGKDQDALFAAAACAKKQTKVDLMRCVSEIQKQVLTRLTSEEAALTTRRSLAQAAGGRHAARRISVQSEQSAAQARYRAEIDELERDRNRIDQLEGFLVRQAANHRREYLAAARNAKYSVSDRLDAIHRAILVSMECDQLTHEGAKDSAGRN